MGILSNDEEQEYNKEMNEIDIRFLNVGGYVIPLVSPKFMSDLVGDNDKDKDDKYNENEQEIESLKDQLEELQIEIKRKDLEIKTKDNKIDTLKGENSKLNQSKSRQSLLDLNTLNN